MKRTRTRTISPFWTCVVGKVCLVLKLKLLLSYSKLLTGGDIQKWVKSNAVKHVVFADIAETSVEQVDFSNLQVYLILKNHKNPHSARTATGICTHRAEDRRRYFLQSL